ncbi:uncharacterized protein [Penaeus vannamei]|uniref:uncharacterized protein n=1 Tax=Penaeus vannamei TaxID=6689 RepID=UPI00387F3810
MQQGTKSMGEPARYQASLLPSLWTFISSVPEYTFATELHPRTSPLRQGKSFCFKINYTTKRGTVSMNEHKRLRMNHDPDFCKMLLLSMIGRIKPPIYGQFATRTPRLNIHTECGSSHLPPMTSHSVYTVISSPTSDTLWHPSTFHKTVYKAGSPASDGETATTPLYRSEVSIPAHKTVSQQTSSGRKHQSKNPKKENSSKPADTSRKQTQGKQQTLCAKSPAPTSTQPTPRVPTLHNDYRRTSPYAGFTGPAVPNREPKAGIPVKWHCRRNSCPADGSPADRPPSRTTLLTTPHRPAAHPTSDKDFKVDNRLLDTLVPYNSTVKYDLTSLSTNTEFYSSYSHRNLTDTHCPDPRVSDTSDLFKDVCYLNNPLSATTGHSITGKAATPSAPASDKVSTGPPDASATTGHSITGKAATPSAPASDKVSTGPPELAPLPLLHRAPHSRRSHPHQVTGTSPHQRPPQDALPSVITRMFGTVGVPPMVASFKPEADSLSTLPRISETSGLSRLVVSLTPEDELPSAAPHVSETIGVSHLVVSLKPEDGLPSVPSRVTVICYDSAVDIRVKPEDGLPSEILRASEVAVLDLPTPTRATSVTHALGLPTPAAPVASHTLSIVLPSVD